MTDAAGPGKKSFVTTHPLPLSKSHLPQTCISGKMCVRPCPVMDRATCPWRLSSSLLGACEKLIRLRDKKNIIYVVMGEA